MNGIQNEFRFFVLKIQTRIKYFTLILFYLLNIYTYIYPKEKKNG